MKGLKISLYNKTKEFNFDVVSFTFPHSNIPNELRYSIFDTQVLRYGHISSSIDIFILSLKELYSTMISRRYYRSRVIRCIKRCLRNYSSVFAKFDILDDSLLLSKL